jgi:undecaprenyl pyrophosphate phosphatase UppP
LTASCLSIEIDAFCNGEHDHHYRALVIAAIIWGLIQGLTEFLPVSSSGHLVVIPALLSKLGFNVAQPDLAVTAVLHLGTAARVLRGLQKQHNNNKLDVATAA